MVVYLKPVLLSNKKYPIIRLLDIAALREMLLVYGQADLDCSQVDETSICNLQIITIASLALHNMLSSSSSLALSYTSPGYYDLVD